MSSDAGVARRREARFQVINPQAISVLIERGDEADRPVSAVLMDLSRGGLRLAVDQALPQGEEVRLTIAAEGVDREIHADAKICWASPDLKEGWFLGCALAQKIDQESIDELAAGSALERRRDRRQTISFKAEARTELNSEFESVQIVNYSAGGFCILAENGAVQEGDRLMVRLPSGEKSEPQLIRAKVAWVNTLDDGQSIGCTFLTRHDYSQMQALVNPGSRSRWLRDIQRHRPTQWRMIAAAIFLILTLQLAYVAKTRPDLVQQFDEQVIQRVEPWFRQFRDSLFS